MNTIGNIVKIDAIRDLDLVLKALKRFKKKGHYLYKYPSGGNVEFRDVRVTMWRAIRRNFHNLHDK